MSISKPKTAVVIGAGIAGLSVAIHLQNAGFNVEVFESNEYPGGKLTDFSQRGYRFDMGPSLFTMPQFVEELFSIYHSRVPFVKTLMKGVSNRAQQRGQIRTLLGRLCRFHLWEPNSFGMHKALPFDQAVQEHGPGIRRAYTYKALNKLIQGSAADMTKKSMLELYKEGIVPHIQIHDELDISVESDKQAKRITEIMESAVDLEIPNKVDYESGKNWGDIH